MAEIKKDVVVWHEAWLDTPFATPGPGLTHIEALKTPGCYVKQRQMVDGKQVLGRLVSIKDDVVTVRSNEPYHDNHGQPFVWVGSVPEYLTTWKCD